MKSVLFSSAVLLLLETTSAFAQSSSYPSPAITFAPGIASQVFGQGSEQAKSNVLNCPLLINKTWPYPNAQVTGICDDATTACIRYSLIVKSQKKAKEGRIATLKTNIPLSYKETEMKILGCVVAIESTVNGEELLTNTTGTSGNTAGMY